MSMVTVPLSKAKVKSSIELDTDSLHEDVYREALIIGLKTLLTRGTSKLTEISDEASRKAELEKIAAENLEKCKEGTIRFTAGKAKGPKVSGAVNTEAMRLARAAVKDSLKAAGMKISHYAASDITAAAKALLEDDPTILEQAKVNLEARAAVPVKINVSAIPTDAKKVAAAEAKKAKGKTKGDSLSAKQAGLPTKRKGQTSATAH